MGKKLGCMSVDTQSGKGNFVINLLTHVVTSSNINVNITLYLFNHFKYIVIICKYISLIARLEIHPEKPYWEYVSIFKQ